MPKTEGRTNIQVKVGNKVVQKTIKSVHNTNAGEVDREITKDYGRA